VAQFLGAGAPEEIVFTAGTTAAINLVAAGLARWEIGPGDEVWVTALEHHSNWVPWQKAVAGDGGHAAGDSADAGGAAGSGGVPQGAGGAADEMGGGGVGVERAGAENEVRAMCDAAHEHGARVLVDGAQGVAHLPGRAALGCDFFAFSGHKMYGPMGIGALWGRRELLEPMEPLVYGGEMIARVEEQTATWAEVPYRFEGGTPNVAGAVGLAAAIDWVQGLPAAAHAHVAELARQAAEGLAAMRGVKVWGPAQGRCRWRASAWRGCMRTTWRRCWMDAGVAVRAGHMCAQPLMRRLGVESAVRASFAPYNVRTKSGGCWKACGRAGAVHMNDLYQAALLAHAKNPHGAGKVPRGTEDAEALNSGCGDEIRVKLTGRRTAAWRRLTLRAPRLRGEHGGGLDGRGGWRARRRRDRHGRGGVAARLGQTGFEEEWGDFQALNGIERFPARIHCARLVWQALEKALAKKRGAP
jgi:cysteine desulfurase / selenocysteine lyase